MKLTRSLGLLLAVIAGLVVVAVVAVFPPRSVFPSNLVSTAPAPRAETSLAAAAADLPGAVGDLLRSGDCAGARREIELAPLGETDRRLFDGFLAHACGGRGAAGRLAAPAPGHPLEDWRQLVLADALRVPDRAGAEAALAPLLAPEVGSPLAAVAAVWAVEWALSGPPTDVVDRRLAAARRRQLPRELRRRLEERVYAAGGARAREAARYLAAEEPLRAIELGAERLLVGAGGIAAWAAALDGSGLRRRAANLLAAGRAGDAHEALLAVPARERDLDWTLEATTALARSARGGLALKLLAGVSPSTAAERARIDLAAGEAALEAARRRRGRPAPEARTRARLRGQALEALARAAAQTQAPAVAESATRVWATHLLEEKRFSAARPLLARLAASDRRDLTGARPLFDAGFERFRAGGHRAAIEHFTLLSELYPDSSDARRGRYWCARSHLILGESQTAASLLAEIAAADTQDFYHRQALARLRRGPDRRPAVAAGVPPGWPSDPRLERAELLLRLGLDQLALLELAVTQDGAEPRAVAAIRGRALAGMGQHRESIRVLREAFDALGTANQASVPAEALRVYYPLPYRAAIDRAARAEGLPAHLVYAMIRQESAFDRTATSHAGARGLLQLMPATGREVAGQLGLPFSPDELVEPETNVRLGVHYFRRVLAMFGGEVDLALAGYNAGPYRVLAWWRRAPRRELDLFLESLPLEEPRTYVRRINLFRDSYRQLYPSEAAPRRAESAR